MDDDLGLLLCYADEARPVLDAPLPLDTAAPVALDVGEVGAAQHFAAYGGDPGSLEDQGWGLIVPDSAWGTRAADAIGALRKRRAAQQGLSDVPIFRVPPDLKDAEAAADWVERVYNDEGLPVEDRPRYLLMLGDADVLSWELQHQLVAADAFVGRLAASQEEGLAAYADKVLRWEGQAAAEGARSLFFNMHDGTGATRLGYEQMMKPTLAKAREQLEKERFDASAIVEVAEPGVYLSRDDFLDTLSEEALREPGALFSVSHGAGPRRGGWESAEEQRAEQGKMSFGGDYIMGADVGERPFLPGGFWFYFACFGAGTPSGSAYFDWLKRLHELSDPRVPAARPEAVLKALPKEGDRPFVAALPKALLQNPNGPLGVVGHVDLAWTYSFTDRGRSALTAKEDGKRARSSRYHDILRSLVGRKRFGPSFNSLRREVNQANHRLAMLYGKADREGETGPVLSPEEAKDETVRKAGLWMLREDISAFVLLGDPAARLSVEAPKRRAKTEPAALSAAPERDPLAIEEAVFAMIMGDEPPKAIAARFGVTRGELDRWMETYKAGGRAAVSRLK